VPPPRLVAALAVAAAAFAAPPATATAQTPRTLEFPSFHTDLLVRRDGTVSVTENIRIRFIGSWNGLLREIPVEYAGSAGSNYTLRLDVESVTDSAGAPLRWESERAGAYRRFRVWVPDAADAVRTVVLRYTVQNGIRFFEEHDELYWNVTGNDSEYPVHAASATIHLPPEATNVRATSYTGAFGATDTSAAVTIVANRIDVRAARPLGFREGLTVVAGWDPGAVARPTTADRIRGFLLSNGVLVVPFLAFAGMLALWRRHGKDPAQRPIVPRYEPPADLTPAEAGTLIDGSPDLRDITATIVHLAVRGFLIIEETEEKKLLGLATEREFAFRAVKPASEWSALKPHERRLMEAFFRDGARDRVETDDLENVFYAELPAIQADLKKTLVSGGHYLRDPTHVQVAWLLGGLGAGFVVAVGGAAFIAGVLGQQPLAAIVAGVATAIVIAGFGFAMPARTARGARVLEEIQGFEEFLRRVEKDRFDRVIRTPEMFESYLPYAMAFGVEKNWARAFDDIYREPPDWYRGSSLHGFRSPIFVSNMARMATVTGGAMTKAPRSSSSSSGFGGGGSFGGGGFSGGGFGGGRVGGF
jgi:uncharacterized membrane protein YgcG